MKIEIRQIPPEGLILHEEIAARDLDLETETISFQSPIKVEARALRITNTIVIRLNITGAMSVLCSRCLVDFDIEINKGLDLNFPLDKSARFIELDTDIREEIIVDYPMKPLCRSDCNGLCPKCGQNLNEGGCSCGTT
ncbi:MAG: DUF177 domain-containing protein [Candidatus Omnitrophota bacterium]